MSHRPPKFAERFFHWFCDRAHLEGLEGDLYETFEQRVGQMGVWKARMYYLFDVISLLRPSVVRHSTTSFMAQGMINSYLKTTFRTGRKRVWFSLINILGLTLGITSVIFIALFVQDELRYDQHITDLDRKFRIYDERHGEDGIVNLLPVVPPVFAPHLEENFEQVEKAGRVMFDYGGTIFSVGEKQFSEKKGVYAELEVLEILDIELLQGSVASFDQPHAVILSESTFRKFFGDVQFANQVVSIGNNEMQVLGVFRNIPEQSHLEADYIYPLQYAVQNVTEERMNSWVWQQFFTYVQLRKGVEVDAFEDKIQDHIAQQTKGNLGDYGFYYVPYLQPMKDIHLHSAGFEWEIAKRGNFQSIVFLSIAAWIILLIACLNFVNLTTAQAIKRAKEVCVRKFVGANRSQLLVQYGMEATLYTFISGMISLVLLLLFLPYFNHFADKSITLMRIFTVSNVGVYVALLVMLGLIAGFYPAIMITNFKPIMAVKGISTLNKGAGTRGIRLDVRQLLVATQYILSIGLILLALIIQKQYAYLQMADMGFNKDNLTIIPLTRNMRSDPELIRSTFSNQSQIDRVALSYGIPGGIVAGDGVYLPEKSDTEYSCNMFMVDEEYIETMGMKLLAGRNFEKERISDVQEGFVLNETAVKNFGLGNPADAIGEKVQWTVWGTEDSLKTGQVIGVVKDFNFKSLHSEMSSTVLHLGPSYFQNLIVRIKPGDVTLAIRQLESSYRVFEPNRPFEFSFIDDTFRNFYNSERKLSVLLSIFTGLAMITAGIGLFGLMSFSVVSRSREISIRKVLGANTRSVVRLLVSRYFLLVASCLLTAVPVASYFGVRWLENYSYRVALDIWTFVEVAVVTLLYTVLTVGVQAYRGAMANPASRLRSE